MEKRNELLDVDAERLVALLHDALRTVAVDPMAGLRAAAFDSCGVHPGLNGLRVWVGARSFDVLVTEVDDVAVRALAELRGGV